MNYNFFTVIFMLSVICTNAQHKSDISFKEIESNYCRNCYGSLVVKKGNLSDTIYGGQWGNTVDYKLVKINDTKYLNTQYRYMFPGGQTILAYKIYSIENHNFLKLIFDKTIELYRETHRDYYDIPVNYIFERNVDVKIKNGIEFNINLKISYCPEIEDRQCEILFEDTHVDIYKIN